MKSAIKAFVTTAIVTAGLVVGISQAKAQPDTFTKERVVFQTVEIDAEQNQYGTVPMIVRETYDTRYPGLLGGNSLLKREVIQVASEPLIIWQVTLSSTVPHGSYTPERRANAISTRLTNLADSLGVSTLEEMYQAGVVNYETVIFASSDPGDATFDNVVFTLSPGNRDQGDVFVEHLQNYGDATASGEPLYN